MGLWRCINQASYDWDVWEEYALYVLLAYLLV